MRLSALQSGFLGWLASGEEGDVAHLPVRGAQGLAVYQNNYRASLMACLADTCPQTLAWLGEAAFEAAAARHIDRVPPHSWTLDDYADGFPASLLAYYPDDREVGELAQIELVLSQTFVAADAAVLTPAQMGEVDWDTARLQLIPACSLLWLTSNAAAIWMALAEGAPPPPVQQNVGTQAALIWRQSELCRLRLLDADEASMVAVLANGPRRFATMCERVITQWGEEQGILVIGQWLSRWVGDHIIAAA